MYLLVQVSSVLHQNQHYDFTSGNRKNLSSAGRCRVKGVKASINIYGKNVAACMRMGLFSLSWDNTCILLIDLFQRQITTCPTIVYIPDFSFFHVFFPIHGLTFLLFHAIGTHICKTFSGIGVKYILN